MKAAGLVRAVLAVAPCLSASAQTAHGGGGNIRTDRLVALGKVWGAVKYFHPALAYRDPGDWDVALAAAIPRVRQARSTEEFRAAVQAMLDALDDPMTTVVSLTRAGRTDALPDRETAYRWTSSRVLIVTAGSYYSLYGEPAQRVLAQIADSVLVARAVVLDLRSAVDVEAYGAAALSNAFREIERRLTSDTLPTTTDRRRVYYGYDSPGTSGQYRTGFFVPLGAPIIPAGSGRDIPIIFLLNERASAIPATVPLQAAGKALIVYEGDIRGHTVVDMQRIALGEGLEARVRQSEPIFPDGMNGELQPDVVVARAPTIATDSGMERSLALAQAFHPSQVTRRKLAVSVPLVRERGYPEPLYPSLEHRLLAAYRLWSVIEYFYPYKQLLDRPWETVLPEMLPVFEAAANAREYAQTVATMSTRIQDSHAYVAGTAFSNEVILTGLPPLRVRMIEDSLIVTALFDTVACRRAGVKVGDIVTQVDGVDAMTLYRETAKRISVSTPQSGREKATLQFMHGAPGSRTTITLRDRAGGVKHAVLERRYEDYRTLYHRERNGPIVRLLPGDIGYVDLDRLEIDMVDSMFQQLKVASAIILDMRGYPNGTIYSMAPRFTARPRVVAMLGTPMVGHGSPAERSTEMFAQIVQPAPPTLRYSRPTVMLIDERTMSQAELTGMYMKELNGTTFVGSRSAGANGEIATVSLPGGMTVGFTGQSVTFSDGRRLQRLGLEPDVKVTPTIAGIRAGRDDILDAAIRLLRKK